MISSSNEDDFSLATAILQAEGWTTEAIYRLCNSLLNRSPFEDKKNIFENENYKTYFISVDKDGNFFRELQKGLWNQLEQEGHRAIYNPSDFSLDILKNTINSLQNKK